MVRTIDINKMKRNKVSELKYWSEVAISSAQVFLGVFAATLFVGQLDNNKLFVVLLNLVFTLACLFIGWRLIKWQI